MSHSKTPWELAEFVGKPNDIYIIDADGNTVLHFGDYDPEDATLIIDLVNNHEQHESLVAENEALKERMENLEAALKFVIDGYSLDVSHEEYRVNVYRAALDAMEESQP